MTTGQDLMDNLITIIDQLHEANPLAKQLTINSRHKDLLDFIDEKMFDDLFSRLERDDTLIKITDKTQEKDKSTTYSFKVVDQQHLSSWIDEIKLREIDKLHFINSDPYYKKYHQSISEPNFEQPFEIYPNNGQVFMTGSLFDGKCFNAFQSINEQRLKRILLSLLHLAQDKRKTIRFVYHQDKLKKAYEELNLKKFDMDMKKSDKLRKDFEQQATDILYFISRYLIDVNGLSYTFKPALSRLDYSKLDDDEKRHLTKQVRRSVRKIKSSQA